jgi:hypothetical protein
MLWTPHREPRWLVALLAILMSLGGTAFYALWWGAQDFVGALAYTGRLTGVLFIFAGFVMVLGALAVIDHWLWRGFAYSGLVALFGTVTAFVFNALLIIATWRDGDSKLYLALWWILAAGSLVASYLVYRTVEIPTPKHVAAAVIVTSVIPIASFGYNQLYLPYQRLASPVIRIDMTGRPVKKADGNGFAVPVTVTLENRSDVGFYLLGAQLVVKGHKVPLSGSDRRAQWRRDAQAETENEISRWEVNEPGQLVEAIHWMSPGQWVDPGARFVTTRFVELPINTPYDQISTVAVANFARKDRLGLQNEEVKQYSWLGYDEVDKLLRGNHDDYVIWRGRIYENNAIANHTRDPRYVTMWWEFRDSGAYMGDIIERKGKAGRKLTGDETYEMNSRYGLLTAKSGMTVQSLWDIKPR